MQGKCSTIKNLEKRLLCLKRKHDDLTNQLEQERGNSASDEGIIEYQLILAERSLVEKYIIRLSTRLKQVESTAKNPTKKGTIRPGASIILKNSNHTLDFILVEEKTLTEGLEISVNSPIGTAILGKRVGDNINVTTPKGIIHYTVQSVTH